MLDHVPPKPGPIPALILIMLAAATLSYSVPRLSEVVGVDFYHFWGVPVALRLTGHAVASPYREGERYSAVLRDYAATANQPKLTLATRFWSRPDFTGSPLLYAAFAWVSNDYAFSLGAFTVLQIASFAGACVLAGYLCGVDLFTLLCLTMLCLLSYQPLLSDLRVANLGCLQLGYLAGLLGVARALPRAASFGRRAALGGLFLAALALLTLSKPNVALIGALLAMHLIVRHGRRLFLTAAVPAAVVMALALVVPCLYFRSWAVWREWYDAVYGANAYTLVRPVAQGNYSTTVLLSSWVGADVYVIAGTLALLLGASLVAVAAWGRSGMPAPPTWKTALTRLFTDPQIPLAAGILLTMATSPIYWLHYYVVSLIPSLWLLTAGTSSRAAAPLAAAAVVMSSGTVGVLLWWLGWPAALAPSIALSWLPLWGALLITIATRAGGGAAAPMVAVRRPAGRSAGATASRDRKR
jgi:hypothetical protein